MTEATHTAITAGSIGSKDVAEYWKEHIADWSGTGLSKAAYCKRAGVNYHQMIYWSKKLAPADHGAIAARVEQSGAAGASGFVAVTMKPPTSPTDLYLRLPNGIEIGGVQEHQLARLIDLVSHR